MKTKALFLVIVFLILLGAGALVKLLSARSPKEGELRVEANPQVSVFLDNKHIGRTPLREKIKSGEYTLRLTPESAVGDITPWEGKISIGPSLLTYINATLSGSELSNAVDVLWLEKSVAKKPELSVITNPDGASVIVDEVTHGITPITISDLDAGEHTLTVSSPGFLTRTMKIKLTLGYKLIASLKMALTGTSPSATPTPEATASGGLTTPTPTGRTSPTRTPTGRPGVSLSPTRTATSSAVPDPDRPFVTIRETPTGFLRVRSQPSTAASEVSRVNPGEKYHIYDEQNGWYQIAYNGTDKGWISGQYAAKTE